MKVEIWKPVVGFEGLYEVSNLGNVKSIFRNKKQLALQHSGKGYYKVGLCNHGTVTAKLVHRLVAEAFIPNPYNFPFVDHIDGNKKNNKVENLDWCSAKENSIRAYKKGLIPKAPTMYGEEHPNHVLTSEEVAAIRKLYKPYKYSQTKLAKEFGVSRITIEKIVQMKARKEG